MASTKSYRSQLEYEKEVVSVMINLYCKLKHKASKSLCMQCLQLEAYAHKRLNNCTFGEQKPTCQQCPIHCYKKDEKRQIQQIMRYSGPRLILFRPVFFLNHLRRKYSHSL